MARTRHPGPVSKAYRRFAEADPRSDLKTLACSAAQMWPEGYATELIGPGLSNLETPVLIVNGEADEPYIHTVGALVEALPAAELKTLPGCNHLTAIDAPEFRSIVLEFLAG